MLSRAELRYWATYSFNCNPRYKRDQGCFVEAIAPMTKLWPKYEHQAFTYPCSVEQQFSPDLVLIDSILLCSSVLVLHDDLLRSLLSIVCVSLQYLLL